MSNYGHNETAVRLAALAGDAQVALDKVARGEADAIEGWLAYGAALNEGRALFPKDEDFGKWVVGNGLRQVGGHEIHDHERAAAMWAAANEDQLAEAQANSSARTVRGWHDKWKKIEAARETARLEAERKAEQDRRAAEAKAARKEAEAHAAAEAEARAVAKAAKDEAEREAAEARAAEEAAAKEIAEKAAAEAEAIASPPPPPDPNADERKKLADLTREALEDEVIGLRAEVKERKAEIAELKAERDGLKDRLNEATQGDLGRALGNAQRRADQVAGRMREHQATAARLDRQNKALKAEVAKLKSEIENQMIPLNF